MDGAWNRGYSMVTSTDWRDMSQQWLESYMQATQGWIAILPYLLMEDQVHGVSHTQRHLMDNIADQYTDDFQKIYNIYLQSFSLHSEAAECYMELINKMFGIKT